jgi:hypothetical protein
MRAIPNESSRRKRAAIGIALLALALALGFLASNARPEEPVRNQWKGFRTLLVEESIPEREVLARLGAEGLTELISESLEPVQVSDWKGLETISFAKARESIVPGDPRLDAYLQRIGLWFDARDASMRYRIFYIKETASGSNASVDRSIDRGLSDFKGRYILPQASFVGAKGDGSALAFALAAIVLLSACALGGAAGHVTRRRLGYRWPSVRSLDRAAFRLAMILPWLALAGGGVLASALSSLCGLAIAEATDSLDLPLDEFRRGGRFKTVLESLSLQRFPPVAISAVALAYLLLNSTLFPAFALACLGSVAAGSGYALLAARPRTSRHTFIPVPIAPSHRRPRGEARGKLNARAALACATILASLLYRMLAPSVPADSTLDTLLPRPVSVDGGPIPTLAEARARASAEVGTILPGLGSYLVHLATQDSLPFARLGEIRPDPFASASLPTSNESAIAPGVAFSNAWAREALAAVNPLSVEGMLLRQGTATVARLGSLGGGDSRPLAPIECLLYILLLVPPIGRILLGAPFARDAASRELRQEA